MSSRATTQSSEVAAFAAALDDFRRASSRARGRLVTDGELTLSQYHLLEPLVSAEAPLGVGELACADEGVVRMTRKREGIERRHDDLFQSLEPGERGQAARLLGRLAAAIEG